MDCWTVLDGVSCCPRCWVFCSSPRAPPAGKTDTAQGAVDSLLALACYVTSLSASRGVVNLLPLCLCQGTRVTNPRKLVQVCCQTWTERRSCGVMANGSQPPSQLVFSIGRYPPLPSHRGKKSDCYLSVDGVKSGGTGEVIEAPLSLIAEN